MALPPINMLVKSENGYNKVLFFLVNGKVSMTLFKLLKQLQKSV